jgi:hypothetical protein
MTLCVLASPAVPAGQQSSTPEAAVRQLVRAIYAGDVEAYNRVTTEHPRRGRLTERAAPNPDALRRLDEHPDELQLRELRPVLHRGKPIEGSAAAPAGATALFMVAHGGGAMVVPLVRRDDGWKVDVRWWIASIETAGGPPAAGAPETAIKMMLLAMLSLERSAASRQLTDSRSLDLLFDGAPRSREPSGVLDASVVEMPLVEVGAGEFYLMPTGRVVEGGSTADRKVLVGMFGPTEMAFVVRRIDGAWRVEAEPYFALMLR